jgi:hypothetical protein
MLDRESHTVANIAERVVVPTSYFQDCRRVSGRFVIEFTAQPDLLSERSVDGGHVDRYV